MADKRPTKTINISTEIHQQLKITAAQEGKTVQQLIEEVLRASLGLEEK